MRSRDLIYIALIFAVAFPAAGFALESPGAGSPLGLGTVPPTAVRSGLVPSINPVDSSGNLIITGNVTGGMQFRGIVPYSSGTDFQVPIGTLGNTSGGIDSFLKRTEGTPYSGQATSGFTPYYSPSLSVAKTIPGSRGIVTSQNISGYAAPQYSGISLQSMQSPRLESGQTGIYQRRLAPQLLQRPLSTNPMDIEKSIEADVSKYPLGGEKALEEQSLEQFWRQMGVKITRKTEQQTEETKQTGGVEPDIGSYLKGLQTSETDTSGRSIKEQAPSTLLSSPERPLTVEGRTKRTGIAGIEGAGWRDTYERMKIQLGTPIKTEDGGQRTEDGGRKMISSTLRSEGQAEPNTGTTTETSVGSAERVLETYKSFAAYNNDKFNKNIRAAEYYMKQGRYYRAADAYTLATAYKPEDPLGYAGKSIALFATGEYMSSSLFLARAIEIFPEYPKARVDLVEMTGDKDMLESRIAEAREWLEKSQSGELAFLLSYVYYQLDRLEFARQTIEYAASKLPDSQAIAAMKKAVDERLGKQ